MSHVVLHLLKLRPGFGNVEGHREQAARTPFYRPKRRHPMEHIRLPEARSHIARIINRQQSGTAGPERPHYLSSDVQCAHFVALTGTVDRQ